MPRTWFMALGSLLGLVAGCTYFNTRAYAVLDYRIDRPRVLGVRVTLPDDPYVGGLTRIEALPVVPQGRTATEVSVDICDDGLDQPVGYLGFDCFSEPELVRHLGADLPLTWDLPRFEAFDCDGTVPGYGGYGYYDDGCSTYVPVLITVSDGEAQGYGGLTLFLNFITFDYGGYGESGDTGFLPEPDPQLEEWEALDPASPGVFTVEGTPRAGGEVRLAYTSYARAAEYAWYVDDGELARTGRTSVQAETEEGYRTDNVLRIPDDYTGPLRVFVAFDATTSRFSGWVWSETVLEVAP